MFAPYNFYCWLWCERLNCYCVFDVHFNKWKISALMNMWITTQWETFILNWFSFWVTHCTNINILFQQECIRVGCIPSAAVVVCKGGVCLVDVCPGGVSASGVGGVCIPACTVEDNPPPTPLWMEWLTGVKTIPCRNFVADRKNDVLEAH